MLGVKPVSSTQLCEVYHVSLIQKETYSITQVLFLHVTASSHLRRYSFNAPMVYNRTEFYTHPLFTHLRWNTLLVQCTVLHDWHRFFTGHNKTVGLLCVSFCDRALLLSLQGQTQLLFAGISSIIISKQFKNISKVKTVKGSCLEFQRLLYVILLLARCT